MGMRETNERVREIAKADSRNGTMTGHDMDTGRAAVTWDDGTSEVVEAHTLQGLISGGINYAEGSVIEFEAPDGSVRKVTVGAIEPGTGAEGPGFHGTTPDGVAVFGYDTQVTRVVSR